MWADVFSSGMRLLEWFWLCWQEAQLQHSLSKTTYSAAESVARQRNVAAAAAAAHLHPFGEGEKAAVH